VILRENCSREDDGGDVIIAELVMVELRRTEETVGEPSSGGDGDGGQEPLAGNVADGRDAGNVRVLVLVNDDVAFGGRLDTEGFQTEVFGVSVTADCPQENVCVDGLTGCGVNGEVSGLALDSYDLGLTVDFDAGVFHPGGEDVLDVMVESSEDGLTADEEMGLGSEGVEDTGEFDGDVASTGDDDTFRLVLELEETVGGDTEAGAGNIFVRGDGGATTDGDTNVFSVEDVGLHLIGVGDLDLGGGKDGSVTVEKVDVLPLPVGGVDTSKLLYVGVALELEGGPVELWLVDVFELVVGGLTKLVSKICSMPHQFFWDAS
jgi:hypothetical protein